MKQSFTQRLDSAFKFYKGNRAIRMFAKNLLAQGVLLETVSKETGLNLEQIKRLGDSASDFYESFSIRPGLTVDLKRYSFAEDIYDNYKLLGIQNSAYDVFGFHISVDPLTFPKLYAGLTYLTGPGDNCYDSYKGSYAFSFELEVKNNNKSSQYVYIIYHFRSYIEFSLRQIVPKTDPRETHIFHKPDDTLFSNEDICDFSMYFCIYAILNLDESDYKPQPFVKHSDSNLLLFWYDGDEYFFESYDDTHEYEKDKVNLKNITEEQANKFEKRIAKKLLDQGVALEIISQATGLSVEQLNKL